MKDKYIIYGLCDPDTEEVRYIGKSSRGLERPRQQLCPCNLKYNNHKTNWIKSIKSIGKNPIIKVLKTSSKEDLDNDEIQIIAEYQKNGRITNTHKGGNGGAHKKYHLMRRPIRATCLETGEVKIYESIQSTKKDGFDTSTVSKIAKSTRKSHHGWKFEYLTTNNEDQMEIDRIHLTAFGENKSIRKWLKDKRCNASLYEIKSRIANGLDCETAITKQRIIYQPPKGDKSWASKLKNEDIYKIRNLCDNKIMLQREVAKIFNISISSVCGIYNRKLWSHLEELK